MPVSPPVDGQPGATSWAEAVTGLVNDYDANGATDAELLAERLYVVPALATGSGAATANATTIAAAITAAAGKTVFIRDGVWHYDTALTIPGGTSFVMGMQAALRFTGSGAALVIDGWSVSQSGRVRLGKLQRTSRGWYSADTTSVGVRLRNCSFLKLEVDEISDFRYGIEFMGDAGGTAYNSIHLGRVINNKIGIKYTTLNAGWTNENHVYGGAVRIDGGLAEIPATTLSAGITLPVATIPVAATTGFPTAGTLNIGPGQHVAYTGKTGTSFTGATGGVGTIASGASVAEVVAGSRLIDLSDATANGNTHTNVTLEGSTPERAVIIGGDDNTFRQCRQEQAAPIEFLSGAEGNLLDGGYGNYGPGSPHIIENNSPARNRVLGSRGAIFFSDSSAATPANGGRAGTEGVALNGGNDVLWRSRNTSGQTTGEWTADGRRKIYSAGESYPRVADQSSGVNGYGGTGYGRGNVEPDAHIGRVSGSQPGLKTDCPLIPNVATYTSSGSPVTIDSSLGEIVRVSATGDFNVAFLTGVEDGQRLTVQFKQDATGGRAIGFAFATNVLWIGAAALVVSTTANRIDTVHLCWDAGLSKWVEDRGRAMGSG